MLVPKKTPTTHKMAVLNISDIAFSFLPPGYDLKIEGHRPRFSARISPTRKAAEPHTAAMDAAYAVGFCIEN